MPSHRAGAFSRGKIKSLGQLVRIRAGLKQRGETVVFTNGCFDIVHVGHLELLEAAKRTGDVLVVALNSDSSVRKLKGRGRPLTPEADRARLLAGFSCVDYVVIFKEQTPRLVIEALKPDVLIKGADYRIDEIVGGVFVKEYGGRVVTVPLVKGRSTTAIIAKIAEKNSQSHLA
jgi:rfaE bifunctional protein nucleotidyltransferase chain/domain